MSRSYLELV
jgi:hypothetical protein